MLKIDYTYLHSFCFQYNGIDFNRLFRNASEEDKTTLFNYVLDNLKAEMINVFCLISIKMVVIILLQCCKILQ